MVLPDFKDHENCMQCYPSLYYTMYLRTLLFVVQRNVFISLLWFKFSDAAGNEYILLFEIPVQRLIFTCNIKKKKQP